MERYDSEKGVEYLKIGSFLLGIAKTFAPEDKGEIMEYLEKMLQLKYRKDSSGSLSLR